MPWTKVDDSIIDNAKLLEVQPAARWLYIASLSFARRNQTVGLLTYAQMGALCAHQGLTKKHVQQLVRVGCLIDLEYGFEIHAYEEFNPLTSTERVRKHRRQASATVPETPAPVSVTPLARAPRAGTPQPVPVPIRVSLVSNAGSNTREALAICDAFEGLGGVTTPLVLEDAEGLVAEFRIPTADEFVAAIQQGTNGRAIKSLTYFRQRFRELNDSLRDAGRKPRDHDWGGRTDGLGAVAASKALP